MTHNRTGCRRAFGCAAIVFLLIFAAVADSKAQVAVSPDSNTVIVDEAPEMEVIAYGKTVIIRKSAKGVLTFGGDVIVEGRVDGEVAAIGGNVIQKESGYIGGDVFVIGGKYQPESAAPLRGSDKETVMIVGYEEELRDFIQNPSSLLAPNFSLAYLAQRTLSVLFWFLVSLGFATVASGAVSGAAARFRLTTGRVLGVGMAVFLLATVGVIAGVSFLPGHISAVIGLLSFAALLLAYVFGRVVLHVVAGKIIQKNFLPENSRSDALAIFCGVLVWTIVLSLPYVWLIGVIALFAAGIGLVLTARHTSIRQHR